MASTTGSPPEQGQILKVALLTGAANSGNLNYWYIESTNVGMYRKKVAQCKKVSKSKLWILTRKNFRSPWSGVWSLKGIAQALIQSSKKYLVCEYSCRLDGLTNLQCRKYKPAGLYSNFMEIANLKMDLWRKGRLYPPGIPFLAIWNQGDTNRQ